MTTYHSSAGLNVLFKVLVKVGTSDTNEVLDSLENDAEVIKLGGLSKVLEQLKRMGLLSDNYHQVDDEYPLEPSGKREHQEAINISAEIKSLKKDLVSLIERTKHPDIWDFLINVEETQNKSGLIWVINKIMQQVNIQMDRELKEQYQLIFNRALKLKE